MQKFFILKTIVYLVIKSLSLTVWAFLWILHVSRLFIKQGFTSFISLNE